MYWSIEESDDNPDDPDDDPDYVTGQSPVNVTGHPVKKVKVKFH